MSRIQTASLAIALAWAIAAALIVGLAADLRMIPATTALPHWLAIGILPAALAMVTLPNE